MREVIFEVVLDCLKIERVRLNKNQTVPCNYFTDEYEIYYLLDGEGELFIEKETYYIKKGSLVLINNSQLHKMSFAKGTLYDRVMIQIKEEDYHPLFTINEKDTKTFSHFINSCNGIYELNKEEQLFVEAILCDMVEEINKSYSGYQWMVNIKLIELFIFIVRRKSAEILIDKTVSSRHQKVQEIAEYIICNFSNEQTLEQLADQFLINKNSLSRMFKEVTGFTVIEYINLQRMKKARELLIDKSISITEIAMLLGYESITYFGRIFKRYMGTTPLKYRNKMLLQK